MSNLTFKSNGATQVALYKISYPNETTIQYSKNDGEWNDVQFGTFISLANNDTLAFSGNAKFSKDMQKRYCFRTSGQGTLIVSGELISLVSSNTIEDICEFNSLFSGCTNLVDASQLTLPSNTTKWCYTNMFFDCNQLTAAPTLVATTVKDWAYANMFVKCFALSSAPTLPSATLYPHSFSNMFQNCISLDKSINVYNAQTSPWCYNAMYQGCTSVDVLSQFPYASGNTMSGLYSSTFRLCNNISLTPRIDYSSYANKSCNFLFNRSKSVNAIEVNFEQWPDANATSGWFNGLADTGVFVCPSALNTNQPSYNTIPQNWTVLNYQTMPLTFRALEANITGSVKLATSGTPYSINLKYRKNHGNWEDYTINTTIQLNPGECVSFSGDTEHFSKATSAHYYYVTSGAKMELYGNVMSLVNNLSAIRDDGEFLCLFYNCSNIVNAERFYLPSKSVRPKCYYCMFGQCYSLTKSPKLLPATILATECYEGMFIDCSALTSTPQLPAIDLAPICYSWMFYGCHSLSTAPDLPATGLYGYCYQRMFSDCPKLNYMNVGLTSWTEVSTATENWLSGVANTGKFYKPSILTTTRGVSYIPSGWTVENK